MYYIVQWIDEFNNTQCRKFENETEAGKFAEHYKKHFLWFRKHIFSVV